MSNLVAIRALFPAVTKAGLRGNPQKSAMLPLFHPLLAFEDGRAWKAVEKAKECLKKERFARSPTTWGNGGDKGNASVLRGLYGLGCYLLGVTGSNTHRRVSFFYPPALRPALRTGHPRKLDTRAPPCGAKTIEHQTAGATR